MSQPRSRGALWCLLGAIACTRPNVAPADESVPARGDAPGASTEAGTGSDVARRRPGMPADTPPDAPVRCDSDRLPRVSNEELPPPAPVPDRWRLVDDLGYRVDWLNSYPGNNPLKGDWPVLDGDDFFSLSAASGSLLEGRRIASAAAGAGGQRTATQGEFFFNESLSLDAVLYRGDTVFRPPDWQWRLNTVLSKSGVRADGHTDTANTAAVQALSFEKHLRDVSVHDDFDSMRVGIQTLTSDFRGFLLSDQPLAVRLFGTRDSNVYQYNVALIRSLRKDTVSLNDVSANLPHNDVLFANLYRQDFPRAGVTSEFVAAYNRNREPGMQEVLGADGAPNAQAVRTRHDYAVAYFGYGIDGHYGWLNATAMTALGPSSIGSLAGSPLPAFHCWITPANPSGRQSMLPDTRRCPSGLNATLVTTPGRGAVSAMRATSTATILFSSQPERILMVSGIRTAARTARRSFSRCVRSRSKPEPPLHFTTFFAGHPRFKSTRSKPSPSTIRAASAMTCGSLPKSCADMGCSSS